MNILFVGFGGMGCRHAQSFLNKKDEHDLFVVEPVRDLYISNLSRIGATEDDFKWFKYVSDVNVQIDFAVVATPSEPRFDIVQKLIDKNIQYFLLEKVVFQSIQQFQTIIEKLEMHGAIAYCNFVNRYFPQYLGIKELTTESKDVLQMTVIGGDFGLGCNGLHYLDLFEYITGSQSSDFVSNLNESNIGNKRGSQYKEVVGTLVCRTQTKSGFNISAKTGKKIGVEVTITTPNAVHHFDEDDQMYHFYNLENMSLQSEKFVMLPSSSLTYKIFQDIFKNECLLPTVQQTLKLHGQFFDQINKSLLKESSNDTICPVT
ncbi:putative dehydrogenase [Pedobacter sp. UYP24]